MWIKVDRFVEKLSREGDKKQMKREEKTRNNCRKKQKKNMQNIKI